MKEKNLNYLGLHMLSQVSFRLERELAVTTVIRTQICVCSQMLFQHAGLLAANSTNFTDVLPPSSAADVLILLVAFKSSFGQT